MESHAEIENLILEAGLYHLHTYLVKNRFRRLRIYYNTESKQAAFIAPPEIIVRDENDLRASEARMDDEPLEIREGVPILKMSLDGGESEAYSPANIDRLLQEGEDAVFFNDREAVLVPADFADLEDSMSAETGSIFESLVQRGFLPADGILTSREARALERLESEQSTEPRENIAAIRERIASLSRPNNPAAERYHQPAGLFNFDKQGVNFAPAMGRGEHNVFFEFFIGNRYGFFTPYSFLHATRDPEQSVAIYRELVESTGILDERGRMADATRIRGLRELKSVPDHDVLRLVIDILESAQAPEIDDMLRDISANGMTVRDELRANMERLGPVAPENPALFIKALEPEPRKQLLRFYREARINREIESEIIKNRGIALADQDGHILLLVTDPVVRTAPYYSLLLKFFAAEYPNAGSIRIAYAYNKPGPRNTHHRPHPIVQALISLETQSAS